MDVTFRNVSVSIAGARIISDIDLDVAAGGFVGIVGPNGSGKSTTLRCLYRALTPASGDVAVNGVSVRAISMRENARQVAALTQDMSLDFDFTAAEVIATGRLPHGASLRGTSQLDRQICARATETADVTALSGAHSVHFRVVSASEYWSPAPWPNSHMCWCSTSRPTI